MSSAWVFGKTMKRRGLLAAGLALLPLPVRAAVDASDFLRPMPAAGLYVHTGAIAMTTPDNRGDIANLSVIVGTDAAAVIDTGGSVAVGEQLRDAVRRITDRPLRYVINTHEHPDHVFGNAAFADSGATFVGHAALPRALADRWDAYLRSYRTQLGEAELARVRMIPPSLLVRDRLELDLGARKLTLNAWPAAHTGCDLTVLDQASGTLITGDLLFIRHVPVVDASATGWLRVLDALSALSADFVIPGHGPTDRHWPQAMDDQRRYLRTLVADARAAVAAGETLEHAVPHIASAERDRWMLFDDYNLRNATGAFSAAEWE